MVAGELAVAFVTANGVGAGAIVVTGVRANDTFVNVDAADVGQCEFLGITNAKVRARSVVTFEVVVTCVGIGFAFINVDAANFSMSRMSVISRRVLTEFVSVGAVGDLDADCRSSCTWILITVHHVDKGAVGHGSDYVVVIGWSNHYFMSITIIFPPLLWTGTSSMWVGFNAGVTTICDASVEPVVANR